MTVRNQSDTSVTSALALVFSMQVSTAQSRFSYCSRTNKRQLTVEIIRLQSGHCRVVAQIVGLQERA